MDKPKLEMFGRYLFDCGSNPPVSAKVVERGGAYVRLKMDPANEGQTTYVWTLEDGLDVLAKLDRCPVR